MSNKKIVAVNRKASHDYYLEERFEAGLVLLGTEIKSLRQGHCQLKDAFISFVDHEAYIKQMHIPPYAFGNRFNHDETRERKLLLHKSEIKKLQQQVKLKGYTIVPISLYFYNGMAKLEIALAKGKELHDKRSVEKEKSAQREIQKAMKHRF
ncbi:MAG: SsrA-binding protein SmpB [Erysipelotrichaceae bacterium]